jgi:hypothetical protein
MMAMVARCAVLSGQSPSQENTKIGTPSYHGSHQLDVTVFSRAYHRSHHLHVTVFSIAYHRSHHLHVTVFSIAFNGLLKRTNRGHIAQGLERLCNIKKQQKTIRQ